MSDLCLHTITARLPAIQDLMGREMLVTKFSVADEPAVRQAPETFWVRLIFGSTKNEVCCVLARQMSTHGGQKNAQMAALSPCSGLLFASQSSASVRIVCILRTNVYAFLLAPINLESKRLEIINICVVQCVHILCSDSQLFRIFFAIFQKNAREATPGQFFLWSFHPYFGVRCSPV